MDDPEYGIKNSNIIDKIAHDLHMSEIWTSAAKYVKELYEDPLTNETCSCLISSNEPYMLRRLEFLAVEIRNPDAVFNEDNNFGMDDYDEEDEDESDEGSDEDYDEENENEDEESYYEDYDEEDDDEGDESSEEDESLNERRKRSPATKTLSGGFWPGRYAQRREKRSPARSWPGTYAKSRKARSPATKTLSGAFWPGRYAQRREKRSPARSWPGKYAQIRQARSPATQTL